MVGMWHKPFGIPNFAVGNNGITVSLQPSMFIPNEIGMLNYHFKYRMLFVVYNYVMLTIIYNLFVYTCKRYSSVQKFGNKFFFITFFLFVQ